MKEKKKSPITYLIIGIVVLLLLLFIGSNINMTPKIEYSDFVTMVEEGTYKEDTNIQVSNVKVVGATIYVRLNDSKITEDAFNKRNIGDYYFTISTNAGMTKFEEFMETSTDAQNIKKSYDLESEISIKFFPSI